MPGTRAMSPTADMMYLKVLERWGDSSTALGMTVLGLGMGVASRRVGDRRVASRRIIDQW